MNRRYKLIFSNPVSHSVGIKAGDWVKVHYHFTPNFPANVLEESQIATQLEGVVSKETQLSVLSIVDNAAKEIEKLEAEKESTLTPVDQLMFQANGDLDGGAVAPQTEIQGKQLNGAQTQSLIAIMAQFSAGDISEGQAVNLIATAIGISKGEVRAILNGDL